MIFQTHPGIGKDTVEGEALVASDDFSARYDLDLKTGVFSRPSHKLFGENYVGKILVLNAAKGGVATAWMLREMTERKMAPAAILLNYANPILVQGAAFAALPLLDGFDTDITTAIPNGDNVMIDPRAGTVQLAISAAN